MFNKFYLGITKGMFLEAPLGGPGQNLTVPFNGATNSQTIYFLPPLVFPRMARMAGQLSFICFWRACRGRHSWCGSPHTQASRPNVFGHDLAPSRCSRW